MSRYTKEQFIEKAKTVHGDKYDYSEVEYINSQTKVAIKCIRHQKIFYQIPSSHLMGCGCKQCGDDVIRKSPEEFLNKIVSLYGDLYDFSITNYTTSRGTCKVLCKNHGIFDTCPENLLLGRGCLMCKKESQQEANGAKFFEKCQEVHGDIYDYSKTKYIDSYTHVEINCKVHGPFLILPWNHKCGQGCVKCLSEKKTLSTEEFIKRAKQFWGDTYSYEKTEYKNALHKVNVECRSHGVFSVSPSNHISGRGCKKCANEKFSQNQTYTTEGFIAKAQEVHDYKYNYSQSIYEKGTIPILIECPLHGLFSQVPEYHLSGRGCRKCKNSKAEELIDKILNRNGIFFECQKSFEDCRNPITNYKLFFDFYLPQFNLLIEYDGQQHFKPIKWFGGQENLEKAQFRDKVKTDYCLENKITLIRISYLEDTLLALQQKLSTYIQLKI